MTTRDAIIALAGADKFCRTESEGYTHECYEFSIEELEAFYHAAQRQAYERAAKVCSSLDRKEKDYAAGYGIGYLTYNAEDCATAIRALIEGDE